MTFTQARETLGNRDSRKVAGNTHLIKMQDADGNFFVGLRFHGTVIIEFHTDRTVVFTGGWETVTTKRRLNEFLPVGGIYQKAGTWFWAGPVTVSNPDGHMVIDGEPVEFAEGDEIIQLAGDYRMAVRSKAGLVKGCF